MKQLGSRLRVHRSAGPERLPSPGAPRVTLARAAQSPPPCPRLCRRRAGFRRLVRPLWLAPGKARPAAGSGAHHPRPGRPDAACRLLQSLRFSSTTTETDPLTLHAPQRVTPLRGVTAGSPALACKRRPSCLESRGQHGLTSTPAPLRTMTRRRALPRTDRPGHLMSRKHARARPEKPCTEVQGRCPHAPVVEQRTRRRSHKGPRSAPFREEDPGSCTRGAFLFNGRPGGRCEYPQVVTSLWTDCTTPFIPPRARFGVDVPSGRRRVDCP